MMRKLLFISGDTALAQGKKGPFYYMLEEFSKYWDRVDIICPKTTQKIFNVYNNIYIHVSNKPRIFQSWFILKKGLEIYKQEKFDIFGIHSYPPFYNDIGGKWLHNKIKTPYVLEVMHITGYPRAGDLKEWFYKILTKIFIKFFSRKASAVRVINQNQTAKFLMKSGVKKDKIKYAPAFYIDFDIFKPENAEKKYDVVFSGRLVENKGIFLLLRAIKELKAKNLLFKIIITGDGPLKNKIQKYVEKNFLQDNVKLTGWLQTVNDLAEIYNQSKILVMPSFNEGGPRVTLEAMACKTAIITSKVGVMLDIIQDGKNGLFIDWRVEDIINKILLLLNNDKLRMEIAENGYQTIQQFKKKELIRKYAEVYSSFLNAHTSACP